MMYRRLIVLSALIFIIEEQFFTLMVHFMSQDGSIFAFISVNKRTACCMRKGVQYGLMGFVTDTIILNVTLEFCSRELQKELQEGAYHANLQVVSSDSFKVL